MKNKLNTLNRLLVIIVSLLKTVCVAIFFSLILYGAQESIDSLKNLNGVQVVFALLTCTVLGLFIWFFYKQTHKQVT